VVDLLQAVMLQVVEVHCTVRQGGSLLLLLLVSLLLPCMGVSKDIGRCDWPDPII
jgi:hypothetical protein